MRIVRNDHHNSDASIENCNKHVYCVIMSDAGNQGFSHNLAICQFTIFLIL